MDRLLNSDEMSGAWSKIVFTDDGIDLSKHNEILLKAQLLKTDKEWIEKIDKLFSDSDDYFCGYLNHHCPNCETAEGCIYPMWLKLKKELEL